MLSLVCGVEALEFENYVCTVLFDMKSIILIKYIKSLKWKLNYRFTDNKKKTKQGFYSPNFLPLRLCLSKIQLSCYASALLGARPGGLAGWPPAATGRTTAVPRGRAARRAWPAGRLAAGRLLLAEPPRGQLGVSRSPRRPLSSLYPCLVLVRLGLGPWQFSSWTLGLKWLEFLVGRSRDD